MVIVANIVNIVDQRVKKKTPEFFTYTLAKHGLWTLTQTAAQALAPRIKVNAIGPGPTLKGYRQSKDNFTKFFNNTTMFDIYFTSSIIMTFQSIEIIY